MSRIFELMEIHGWKQDLENILLSTLLTGDRALLISQPGAAKTLLPQKICRSLNLTFAPFDLNAMSFEDIVGFLDIPAMSKGELRYISAPSTIWGKQFVSYEEINRCKQTTQGKVLEHLRSGTIMGMPTGTKWCWANMNPVGHTGTNKLTPAIVDRFSVYVWAPDLLDMEASDRAKISEVMTSADAPALTTWIAEGTVNRTKDNTDYAKAGEALERLLKKAALFLPQIQEQYPSLPMFLSLFSESLYQNMSSSNDEKTIEPIRISGRRLAMIRRTILALRAVELALDAEFGIYLPSFKRTIEQAINASMPVGINEEEITPDSIRNVVAQSIRQSYHALDSAGSVEQALQYELFCSRDPIRRAEILLGGKLTSEEILTTGWHRLSTMNTRSADMLSFIALSVDAKLRAAGKNSILPVNVLNSMRSRVTSNHINPELPKLPPHLLGNLSDINKMIEDATNVDPVEGVVVVETIHEFLSGNDSTNNISALKRRVTDNLDRIRGLLLNVK